MANVGDAGVSTPAPERLMLYDPEFARDAAAFVAVSPGRSVAIPVKDLNDFTAAMTAYQNIKELDMNFHGGPGEIQLPDRTKLGAGSIDFAGRSNKDFLAPGARILFEGCDVGAGSKGETFLDDIGKSSLLLGKGGIIGAATVGTWNPPFSGNTYLPKWGNLKTYKYDGSGKRVGQRID